MAPTGVAAINAGGVTLHSLFQLPFGSFIPVQNRPGEIAIAGHSTIKHVALKKTAGLKRQEKLIYELELLIIDEVSMVRADLLDAVDTILRVYRKKGSGPVWRCTGAFYRRSLSTTTCNKQRRVDDPE